MAVELRPSLIMVGHHPPSPGNGIANLSLSSAGTWIAYSFIPNANRTVNTVDVYFRALAGTLAGTDVQCHIFSDLNGSPNASLGSTTTQTGGWTTPVQWVTFTGLSIAVTAGTQYWVVLKNVNATPATNNPNFRYGGSNTGGNASQNPLWGNIVRATNNSGTNWAFVNGVSDSCIWRVGFSDGSFAGNPVELVSTPNTNFRVYDGRELGNVFTLPFNTRLSVIGISMFAIKNGTPPAGLVYRLYAGTILLGTTRTVPVGNVPGSGQGYVQSYFSSAINLQGGNTVRVTAAFSGSSGGDTSNYYDMIAATIKNDSGSKAMFPFAAHQTYFDSSVWDDSQDALIPYFALLLGSAGEYSPPWPRHGSMTGGFNG